MAPTSWVSEGSWHGEELELCGLVHLLFTVCMHLKAPVQEQTRGASNPEA